MQASSPLSLGLLAVLPWAMRTNWPLILGTGRVSIKKKKRGKVKRIRISISERANVCWKAAG